MKVFLAVVDEGSFTAAARSLAMTVPHVTRHIASLEEQLGTRLLQRTTRRMSLTSAGERYVPRVREILEAVDVATMEAQNNTSALQGTLRIVSAPSLTDSLIAPLAASFLKHYPKLALDIYVDANPLPDLNKYDLGFLRVAEGFDSNIVARTLSTSEAILCAAPSYLARHGRPQTPQDLSRHACVLRRPASLHRPVFSLWANGHSVTETPAHVIEVTPAITINFTASLMQMVLDGAGIGAFAVDVAQPFIDQGTLQQVLPEWITGRYTVLAALPSRKHLPERTKVFLDFVFEQHKRP